MSPQPSNNQASKPRPQTALRYAGRPPKASVCRRWGRVGGAGGQASQNAASTLSEPPKHHPLSIRGTMHSHTPPTSRVGGLQVGPVARPPARLPPSRAPPAGTTATHCCTPWMASGGHGTPSSHLTILSGPSCKFNHSILRPVGAPGKTPPCRHHAATHPPHPPTTCLHPACTPRRYRGQCSTLG